MAINMNSKKEVVNTRLSIAQEIRKDVTIEYIEIDGIRAGVFGYKDAEDRQRGIDSLTKIIEKSDKHGWDLVIECMTMMNVAAELEENEIPATAEMEMMEISGKSIGFYADRKVMISADTGEIIADIKELKYVKIKLNVDTLDIENVKAVLTEEAKGWIKDNTVHDDEDEEDCCEECECDGNCDDCWC